MKKLIGIISGIILVIGALNFDKVLISSMNIVDWYGYKTNTSTIEVIDGLNEIYYKIYE